MLTLNKLIKKIKKLTALINITTARNILALNQGCPTFLKEGHLQMGGGGGGVARAVKVT